MRMHFNSELYSDAAAAGGPTDKDSAACLCSLERLQMAFCRSLAALPDGIGELQQLAVLDVRSVCHMAA